MTSLKKKVGVKGEEEEGFYLETECTHFRPLKLPFDFPLVKSEEEIEKNNEKCIKNILSYQDVCDPLKKEIYCLPIANCEELRFPVSCPHIIIQNKLCKYLWNLRCLSNTSDLSLFKELRNGIRSILKRLKINGVLKSEVLILNNCLCQLSSLDVIQKHRFIDMIAKLFSYQNNIKWISAENEFLLDSDGLRLLLVFSMSTGKTLEYLHIWNFMRDQGFNSCEIFKNHRRSNLLDCSETGDNLLTEGVKTIVWERLVTPQYVSDIPKDLHYFAYYFFLRTLENLNTLSIKYSMLAGCQGESVLDLECIRNGKLRVLNLLCTLGDLPRKTSQVISNASWAKAVGFCPLMKVNLVTIQVIDFDDFKQILVEKMPLEGFHISSSFIAGCDEYLLDCSMLLLLKFYKQTLKRLDFNLRYPFCVDFAVTRLISGCHYLEEFEYRGKFSMMVTIRNICEFYTMNKTRLRKLYLWVKEDPCSPNCYKKPLQELQKEYESHFVDKGIDFQLATYRI